MPPQAPPSVSLTAWRTVAAVAVGAAAAGWTLYFALDRLNLPLPVPPLLAAGVIIVVAAVIGWLARLTRQTIRRREPLAPTAAVARLALGKSALLAGAALAGGYAGVALYAIPFLGAELPRSRALGAAASMLASIIVAVAGRCLERACEIPPSTPDEDSATPSDHTSESGDAG